MAISSSSTPGLGVVNQSPPIADGDGHIGLRILNLKAYLSQCFPMEHVDGPARIDAEGRIWVSGEEKPDSMIGKLPDGLAFAVLSTADGFRGYYVGSTSAIAELTELESQRQRSVDEYDALTDQIYELMTAGIAPVASGLKLSNEEK